MTDSQTPEDHARPLPRGAASPPRPAAPSPHRQHLVRLLVVGTLLGAVAIASATLYLSARGERDARSASALTERTHTVIETAERLLTAIQDVETGQRGFLLTGDGTFLPRYHTGSQAVWATIPVLQDLTADNPAQQGRVQALSDLLRERMLLIDQSVELARADDLAGARAVVRADENRHLATSIRQMIATLQAEEQGLLQQRRAGEQRVERRRRLVLNGMAGIAALTLALSGVVLARMLLASAAARRSAATLERHVVERTAALATAEARFRAIFDSQFQFITLLAPDGIVLEVNRTALDAAALTRGAVIGRPFWETGWWLQAARDRLRQDIARAAAGVLIRHEVEYNGAGGRLIHVDFSLTPVRAPATQDVLWIIAEGRDITEQRELAGQLAQVQKVQALGQLASGIAHDFNNILQTVSGAAMLIERRPEDHERTRRLARTAIDATTRGASITQRLLSFARRGEPRLEAIATTELLNSVREVLAHTLGTHITVRIEAPAELPALLADRGQLETALVNLGTNARDAMPDGGTLMLSAAPEHVAQGSAHPDGLTPGDYISLRVTDTGTGMDPATLARVTEPFFTTKPEGQGTGLGLAMVKGFTEQSGGALSITSTPGQGTTITLWLRQARSDATRRNGDDPGLATTGTPSARILLVDDDDLVRETLAAQLEDMGFATLIAANGAEALALLEAGEVVDALVSDLSMPGMSGVVTIQKARLLRPDLPCFLLTGYVGERAALDAGDAFTLVRKPVAGRTLAARIEARLESGKR
ncbi:Histidine kinase [Rhodovastum atsumiense]|uniref:histidine kinase n=1 Tax=Rhodovastum atsumiense TaxID=504468 RepID=A0A5M6IQD8_9PROT|nr:CHASE3 domain-containing protein [Rhodovastum atsumiense]KAA5610490.1 response regulator [Rhodovastum atsumiense]CAH2600477.1 Histidine kinase [Rhodovastum atsumiense]